IAATTTSSRTVRGASPAGSGRRGARAGPRGTARAGAPAGAACAASAPRATAVTGSAGMSTGRSSSASSVSRRPGVSAPPPPRRLGLLLAELAHDLVVEQLVEQVGRDRELGRREQPAAALAQVDERELAAAPADVADEQDLRIRQGLRPLARGRRDRGDGRR